MVSVAIVAGRCAKVPALVHGSSVDTSPPASVLIDGERITIRQVAALHTPCRFMTGPARICHASGVDPGLRIVGSENPVDPMTARAGGYVVVTVPKGQAMLARPILLFLIHSGVGLESLHVQRI